MYKLGRQHMRHLIPFNEARHQLGGISPTTFCDLGKEGELSLVKIGRRSFVQAETSMTSLKTKRYGPSGRNEVLSVLTPSRPENNPAGNERERIGARCSEGAARSAYCLVEHRVQFPAAPPG